MVIRILYFASVRESVGQEAEELVLPEGIDTVGKLRSHIAARGAQWDAFAVGKTLRAAVNQRMAPADTALGEGDEVAFFPPVTGG
jgi:molybdopterin synthase sulfur carrier subunit